MAFSTAVTSFIQPLATGNQSVTGVGFQPKAILFFINELTADGSLANAWMNIGMATSSTARAAISCAINQTTTNGDRAHTNAKCIYMVSGSGVVSDAADFVSMDVDGFTVNWTTVALTQSVVHAVCLGGADLTGVFIKQFQQNIATGAQALTGVGFQPDAVVMMSASSTNAPPANNTGANANFDGFFSVLTPSLSKSLGFSSNNSVLKTDAALRPVGDSTNTLNWEASLTSMDADGFTINWGIVNGARYCWALCLKGGQYKLGVFNQAAGTGNQATTGVGFQPKGMLFFSQNAVSGTAVLTAQDRMTIGAATSSSSRFSRWTGGKTAGPIWDQDLDQTKVVKMMTEGAGGSPTTQAAADYVSSDADGFTVNWTTADATTRELAYFALGNAAGTLTLQSYKTLLGVGL